MVRKYGVYLKEGMKAAKITMKRRGSKISFYLFYLMKLAAFLFPVILPIFKVAEIRMSKQSLKVNDLGILESFKNGAKGKIFWNNLLSSFIVFAILLGGILGIAGLTWLLVFIGMSLGGLSADINTKFIMLLFSIPGMIAIVIYTVFVLIYFSPIPYISDTVDGIEASAILSKSIYALKKGRFIVFLNFLFKFLITAVIGGGLTAVYFILAALDNPILIFVFSIIAPIIILLALFILPRFMLGFTNANTLFFEDTVLDEVTERKVVKGIIVAKSNQKSRGNLLDLFNRTEEKHFANKNTIKSKHTEDSEEEDDEEAEEEFEKAVAAEEEGDENSEAPVEEKNDAPEASSEEKKDEVK